MVRDANRRRVTTWTTIAIVAMVVAVISFIGTRSTPPESTSTSISSSSKAPLTNTTTTAPRVNVAAIRHSLPERIVISTIGVSTSVGVLGLQANGQVMVPRNTRTVGWYKFGPTPGELGSAVILGHVDSTTGPGAFFSLKSLARGDLIQISLADGTKELFAVTSVVTYTKSDFPSLLVYGPHGTRSLNLVTCGGPFDHASGHYLSNVVVYSVLVHVS